jgi:cell filamentation protein
MTDPSIDPQSGILRNKFGLTDQASLNREEANAVIARSMLLRLNPLKGNFDSEHLKAIHFYLFRDVYDWAGKYRTVPLAKAEFAGSGRITKFAPPELIEAELIKVFRQLAKERFLQGLPRKEFVSNIASLLSEINRIHPFREGNGRTQRIFVSQLAQRLGYELHFEVVSRERLVQASVLSAHGDVAMTSRLMDEITNTERIQSLANLITYFEQVQFKWNDVYLATTTPGESYTGTFAGNDGANFFFRDEDNRVLVGKFSDLQQPV